MASSRGGRGGNVRKGRGGGYVRRGNRTYVSGDDDGLPLNGDDLDHRRESRARVSRLSRGRGRGSRGHVHSAPNYDRILSPNASERGQWRGGGIATSGAYGEDFQQARGGSEYEKTVDTSRIQGIPHPGEDEGRRWGQGTADRGDYVQNWGVLEDHEHSKCRPRQGEGRSRHRQPQHYGLKTYEDSRQRPHQEHSQGWNRRRAQGRAGQSVHNEYKWESGQTGSKQCRENRGGTGGFIKFLSWKEIIELSRSMSDQVVQAILNNEAGFLSVFSHSKSCNNPHILKSLIKIIYMLVKSQEKQLASRILGQVYCGDGNCAQFCFQVDRLIKSMPSERGNMENCNCLLYLLEIGLFGIERIPKTMQGSFPKASIINTVDVLHRNGQEVRILQNKCQELQKQFDFVIEQMISAPIPAKGATPYDEMEPPNDFTTIEVLPQNDDLKCGPKFKPFLRSNIIRGGYQGWDHYLDVQFRLLREDFIVPLRDGIRSQYEGRSGRNPEIRVYEQVHVLTPVCLFTGMGFQISFNVNCFKRTNWEHSRRLIFGSLLCLSNNDFQDDSITFATVVKRDSKQLAEGYLTIKFEGDVSGFHIDPTDEYTMVESTAYFEAYRHVLLGLQNASRVQETMPFKRYIVDCNIKDLPLPLHIRTTTNLARFNLSKALAMGMKAHVMITDESTWPHWEDTSLDESQYRALKMALRQELSVIQGPPGTGKTFIGLKLVQAFLHNRQVWDPQKNSPILVVCYTNHALDQFLEEIVEVYTEEGATPPDIVRIGGRCKNENLSNFVLAKRVLALRNERSLPGFLNKQSRDARDEMNRLKAAFNALQQQMNPTEGNVLPLTILQSVMADVHYLQLAHGMPTQRGKEIEVWLNIWYPPESETNEVLPGETDFDDVATFQDVSSPEDDFIPVDEEARLLQDERMLEGEEIVNEFDDNTSVLVPRQNVLSRQKRKTTGTEWQTVQISDKERSKRIKKGFQHKPMKEKDVQEIDDVRLLKEEKRWKLYHHWVSQYLKVKKLHLRNSADHYNETCKVYTDMKQQIDCHVARGADIIGMTTTGAAKHHHILKNIHPKIVIIEEAAEVFESHVITSLSPSVQQLILIGDHKQLRPKPNCYELERKYHLDVSLFERLIINGIPYVTLKTQHRMRPDIASLICPAIYKKLENGPKSLEHGRDKIDGVAYNLFFINHTFPEKQQDSEESRSHVNIHEASFMVSLCRYLLNQGYKATQITLLTMYRGQLMEMKHRMKRTVFEGVRVAAVDDFQGEENDIILLSLVRSNSDANIGFLKIENRVCVSLSRARKGFYVIGNFSMLRERDDTIWPQILSVVDEKQCIGEALPLHCQIHLEEKVLAKAAEDFSKCPEGGCRKPCNFRLKCGHGCPRLCHPWDRDHELFKCQKRCDKMLPCHHKCKRKCCECCTNKCAPCNEMVEKRLQKCGHSIMLPCNLTPTSVLCTKQCQKSLPCGHFCQALCSEPCSPKCYVNVKKSLPCGHLAKVECYLKPEDVMCSVRCDTLLQCLHSCVGTCGRCHQGRLHIHCDSKCGRTLVCGHTCTFPCPAECRPCLQKCKNFCPHSKCPKNCYEPCDPCAEPCEWNCIHLRCTKKCGELCNRPPCNEPCLKRLPCGHHCIGLCGEKCPKLCRVCDREEVVDIFFGTEEEPDARFVELQDCGHVLECSGLDEWMKTQENETEEIQFKGCPKCKTLIRTSLRYYNQIKKVHNDFERIKRNQLDVSKDTLELLRKLRVAKKVSQNCEEVAKDLEIIESLLSPASRPRYFLPHCLSAIQNQIGMLPTIAKIYTALAQVQYKICRFGVCEVTAEKINQDLESTQRFLMQESLTDQQLHDIDFEVRRLQCMFRLFELNSKIRVKKADVSPRDKSHLDALACSVYYSGAGGNPKLSEYLEEEVSELIAHFNKQYSIEGLTQAERTEIVSAMGLSKGHWFKCPNGHIYCITECGGATVEAKCPECDARIGGMNHNLLADNQLAPEMDGAHHAAWSAAANLEDYDLEDLRRFQ